MDASGLHLFPGFRNGHTHSAMTLFRGWGDDMPLMEWLETRIWPAEARLTPEDVYAGARLAILEMLHTGTTWFNDMYWHVEATARAVEEMGIRATLGAAFVDLGQEAIGRKWRAEVEKALELSGDWGPRLELSMAPHAIYSVSGKNLRWLGDLAEERDLSFHIHLSETAGEVESCIRDHGMRPAWYLDSLGLVNDRLVAAHGTFLDASELELLGRAGATVVHNPCANLKLGVGGIFDYPTARATGVKVLLGTDGPASNNSLDMVQEMKFASLMQKHRAGDPAVMPAPQALEAATGGRRPGLHPSTADDSAGDGPSRDVGVWPGAPADLVLVDLSGPSGQPGHDPVSDLVYSGHGGLVHTTICDGRVLVRDGELTSADAGEIIRDARQAARRVTG